MKKCKHLIGMTPTTYDKGTYAEYREPRCIECGEIIEVLNQNEKE